MDLFEKISLKLVPVYRFLARMLIKMIYDIEFYGFDKLPKDGPALLISNHVSYVDGLVIQAAVARRNIIFIIDRDIYRLPVVNYFMRLSEAIPIFPKKEEVQKALDKVSESLEHNKIVCIFPEGQLTYTGHLGRFKPGVEWIIERDPVPIYPLVVRGLWGSIFSRKYLRAKFRWIPRSFRRKVVVSMGEVIHPKNAKINVLQKAVLDLRREFRIQDASKNVRNRKC